MSQVRFWSTVRSQAQIKENMYYDVGHTDPALILYFPLNEEIGGKNGYFEDITGNGHHADEVGNIVRSWNYNVRFDR